MKKTVILGIMIALIGMTTKPMVADAAEESFCKLTVNGKTHMEGKCRVFGGTMVAENGLIIVYNGGTLNNDFTGPGKCLQMSRIGSEVTLGQCNLFTQSVWIERPVPNITASKFFKKKKGYTQLINSGNVQRTSGSQWGSNGICLTFGAGKVTAAKCNGKNNGQYWKIQEVAGQKMKIRNLSTGSNLCLDVINDGVNNKLQMASCGNFSGQFWY